MSDWIVEISHISRQGQADTRSVTVQDFDDPKVAKLAGIEECLKWANEEGSPIPHGVFEFWQVARRTMADYEASTELENRYGITATIKPVQEVQVRPAEPPPRSQLQVVHSNGTTPRPSSLTEMLQVQFESLIARQKDLLREKKRIDDEYETNAADISEIRSFLMLRAGREKKVRKHGIRTRHVDGEGAQQEDNANS